jgi:hypothetical protein
MPPFLHWSSLVLLCVAAGIFGGQICAAQLQRLDQEFVSVSGLGFPK